MAETIGKGVLQVGFDPRQVEQAGRDQLLPGARSVAASIAGVFAAVKIAGFAKEGIDELKQAEAVSAQTAAQIKITGGAAGISASQIDELGQSMLDLAGFDDEAARSAANVLLRFDAIKGADTFKRVEADAADLAITMGTDLPSAAELLGKALQSPDKAARLLRPVIGALTDAQTASIKSFIEQGDVAAAQGVILEALEGKIGGVAKAFGDTLAGSQAKATEEFKNAKAELVAGFAPALQLGADLTVKLAHGVEALPGPLRAVAGAAVFAGSEVLALSQPVAALVTVFGRWKDSQRAAAAAADALAISQQASTVASVEQAAATETLSVAELGSVTATQAREVAAAQLIVSNEALTFSDAEIVAALEARGVAEAQTLLSNDALIASDNALIIENEALAASSAAAAASLAAASDAEAAALAGAGASSLSLVTVLPLLIAGGGIAAGVYSALSDALGTVEHATGEYTTAIETNTGTLADNVDMVTATQLANNDAARSANESGIGFAIQGRAVRQGTDDFGSYSRALQVALSSAEPVEVKTRNLVAALKDAGAGSTEFGQALIGTAVSGSLTTNGMAALVKEIQGLHNGYINATGSAAELEAAQIGLGVATDDTTDSVTGLTVAEQEAKTAAEGFPALIDDIASAMDRNYQSTTSAAKASEHYFAALDDLTKAVSEGNSGSADLTQSSEAVAIANDKEAAAQRRLTDLRANAKAATAQITAAETALASAHLAAERAQSKLNDTTADAVFTLDQTTEVGRRNLDLAFATGDSIAKLIEQRFKETHSVEAAIAVGALYVANLTDQLKAAGATDEQVAALIDTMNLTPEDIKTTFTNNAVEQQIVIAKYIAQLKDIKPEIRSLIEAEINKGEFDLANTQLNNLAEKRAVNFGVKVDNTEAIGPLAAVATEQSYIDHDIDFAVKVDNTGAVGPLGAVNTAQSKVDHDIDTDVNVDNTGAIGPLGAVASLQSNVDHNVDFTVNADTLQAEQALYALLSHQAAVRAGSGPVGPLPPIPAPRVGIGSGGAAEGVANWQGGPLWVGEKGPELLNLPRGSDVTPHTQSEAMFAGMMGAGGKSGAGVHIDTVNVVGTEPRDLWHELPDALRTAAYLAAV